MGGNQEKYLRGRERLINESEFLKVYLRDNIHRIENKSDGQREEKRRKIQN